jgi:RHS repeat-associated protein
MNAASLARDSSTNPRSGRVPLVENPQYLGIEWDANNKLRAVKQGASTLASFTYDGSGRRSSKTTSGVTTTYVYEGAQFLEQRRSTGTTNRFFYGPGIDQVLAQIIDGTTSFNVADHLGSLVTTTDSFGTPTVTREYDPWGNLQQGSTADGYAFTGREWDPEIGLYYYRARYYSAALGRFASEDPIGILGGSNYYAYVSNSPVNSVDGFGLKEGDAANKKRRARVAETADKYIGSRAWMTNAAKGAFPVGSYKCNLFVCDVAEEAGAATRLKRAWPCPTAGEFAGNGMIPNWRLLGDNECPEPGDIVAYAWNFSDASGHSGVLGNAGIVSAHTDGPVDTKFPAQSGAKLVYRRYTGN